MAQEVIDRSNLVLFTWPVSQGGCEKTGGLCDMSASLSSFAGERTTVEDLTGGLPAEIDLPQIPFLYRIGLLLVTAAMILLPLLYLGLIGLLAYGIGYHAVTGTWLLSSSPGSGTTWRLTIYLAPIVAGTIAIVFMFKPLLAEASSPPPLYEAKEADHPELFSFLRRLCRILKAPEPSKVYLDCSINASASFLPGFLNVAHGRLALTLGLPLAAGLDLRQLTGVLAHEFGHFSQSAGMRLTYMIRSINAWFWRVVYERDSWDERLERWSKEGNLHIRLIMEVARGTVWVSRKILAGLMIAGNAISCYLLRQMEFNADAYEIQLTGSEAFEATVGDLEKLNVAWSLAAPEYYRLWNTGRVADDIPALIAGGGRLLPEPKPGPADEPKEVSSSFFDTHPPDFQRIAAARKLASPGLISIAAPASALFKDFEMVCRDVTRHTHRAVMGASVDASNYVPSSVVMSSVSRDFQGRELVNHYFGAAWSQLRALHFAPDHALDVVSLADLLARIDLAQKDVDRLHPTAVEAYETITQADEQILKARKAVALLEIGFVINASEFGLDEPNLACARPAVEQARANRAAAISRLSGWEEACCLRINLALLIPEQPEVCRQIPEGALQRRGELSGFSSMLSGLYPALLELREETEVQATLQYNRQSNMPRLPTALESTSQKIERLLAQIEQAVAHLPDPFSPESERRTLLDSIRYCPFPTDSDDRHAQLLDRGQTAWWSLFDVQFRVNGELLSIAREAERIAGGGGA